MFFKILVLLSLIPVLAVCCNKQCTYKIFDEIPNSKRNYRIVKFYNWCGYTTSNNINLSVLKNGESVENRERIIFIAASKVGANLDRDTSVKASWLNDFTVLIKHDKDIEIFKKDTTLEEIIIKYEIK